MNKIKFTKKRPKRGGIYLVKYEDGFDFIQLYYCPEGRDWWTFDYPHSNTSQPLEDDDDTLWGPRLE